MQAKGLTQLTNMKTADLGKEALEQFCTPMKNAPKETTDLLQRCHPDVLKKAVVMCSDKGDGKDNEEDDKKGDDKDNKEGDKGDDKDDKGDGKGDTNDDKSDDKEDGKDDKGDACAAIADIVRSCWVHVYFSR